MEKILLFQSEQAAAIRRLVTPLKIKVVEVKPEQFGQTLGCIAGFTKDEEPMKFEGELPAESLMVFCYVYSDHLDQVLSKMRQNKIPMTYKAVLTPVNMTWNVAHMYLEMEKEKKAYEAKKTE